MRSKPRPQSSLKGTKVQLRLCPAQKDLIARAARIKQTTLTGFMVERAYSAAQEVLADQVPFRSFAGAPGRILRGARRAAQGRSGLAQTPEEAGRFR